MSNQRKSNQRTEEKKNKSKAADNHSQKNLKNADGSKREQLDDIRAMQQKLKRSQQKLERYKKMCEDLLKEREEMLTLLAVMEDKYNTVENAEFWKMTKPFRWVLDRIKKAFSGKTARKLKKGIRCVKENGLRYTIRLVRSRNRLRNEGIPQLYTKKELQDQKKAVFSKNVKISILVPLYNTPEKFLEEMITSVMNQTYPNWELCLADGSDAQHNTLEQAVKKICKKDTRVVYRRLEKNLGISGNTNACIEMATGDYIALFDHDDVLHPAALYDVMRAICEDGADFVYTDEATFESPNIKKIITAHYKPDFAIDNLRANNYICHLSVFSREVLNRAGMFRSEYDGSQDHDMILRLTSEAQKIVHIPKILYYWRSHPQSVAMDIDSKGYAIAAGKNAVRDHIRSTGMDATVHSSRAFPTIYRLQYRLEGTPRISILIPNKNHLDDLRRCIKSIFQLSTYPDFEVIIVDNGSDDPKLFRYYEELKQSPNIKVCSLDIPFNYSKLNNFAAQQATGEYLILLNNDTKIITPEWMEEMLMYVQRNDVGAAGAKLYYGDDTIQHAGIIIGMGRDGVAGHAFNHQPRGAVGYMGRLYYAQNMSAVTAACMMVKASLYRELGGLDEDFAVAYNDVDFCMRIRKAGYKIVWTPYSELYHFESKSRGSDRTNKTKRKRLETEAAKFRLRWKDELAAGDPYYNPNFSLERDDFSPK